MNTSGIRIEPSPDGQLLLKEGEYGKGTDGIWYCRPPGNHMGSLANHEILEHDDGTITVSPSILIYDNGLRRQWHGHLIKGEWQEC